MNTSSQSSDQKAPISQTHQLKHILFGIMGGFYFSPRFQPWIKYLWLTMNLAVVVITQLLGIVGYFGSSTARPVRNIIYALLTSNVVLLAVLATPCLTYYYRENIAEILTLADDEFFANARVDSSHIRSSKRDLVKMTIVHSLNVSAYICIHPLFFYFSDDPHSLRNLDYYIFPYVGLDRVQTASQYYLIFISHLVAAAITVISFVTISIYVFWLGQEFQVAFLGLKSFLHDVSELARRAVEEPIDDADHEETSRERNDRGEMSRQQLLSDMEVAIRAHQTLHRKMKIIKPQIELLFSSILAILVGDQCFYVYIMCSADLDNFLKTKELLGILHINIILYTYCYVGKILDDAEKMISTQVSDVPWYYLTSQQRKTFYIFLCQTQHPVRFYAFGVYAMNMPVVLQCLKFVFSLFNILRQVLNK